MNQPLDFVTHDLDMMMPGGQPMITGPGMYQTQPGMNPPQPPYGTQPGFQPPGGFNKF